MPGPRQTGNVSMAFQESYPQVRMVWSYFNNLEQEQTEVGMRLGGNHFGDGMISIANNLLEISRIRKRGCGKFEPDR